MKKIDKYYKLVRMPKNERDLFDWLREFDNWEKRILPKINKNDDYLLLEKSTYKVDEELDELYTNCFSLSGSVRNLYKITKMHDAYDYSGINSPTLHYKQKIMNFDDYLQNRK